MANRNQTNEMECGSSKPKSNQTLRPISHLRCQLPKGSISKADRNHWR